ncbi:MAG: hypothetical protein WDW38_002911 [Sanguina aurantia]
MTMPQSPAQINTLLQQSGEGASEGSFGMPAQQQLPLQAVPRSSKVRKKTPPATRASLQPAGSSRSAPEGQYQLSSDAGETSTPPALSLAQSKKAKKQAAANAAAESPQPGSSSLPAFDELFAPAARLKKPRKPTPKQAVLSQAMAKPDNPSSQGLNTQAGSFTPEPAASVGNDMPFTPSPAPVLSTPSPAPSKAAKSQASTRRAAAAAAKSVPPTLSVSGPVPEQSSEHISWSEPSTLERLMSGNDTHPPDSRPLAPASLPTPTLFPRAKASPRVTSGDDASGSSHAAENGASLPTLPSPTQTYMPTPAPAPVPTLSKDKQRAAAAAVAAAAQRVPLPGGRGSQAGITAAAQAAATALSSQTREMSRTSGGGPRPSQHPVPPPGSSLAEALVLSTPAPAPPASPLEILDKAQVVKGFTAVFLGKTAKSGDQGAKDRLMLRGVFSSDTQSWLSEMCRQKDLYWQSYCSPTGATTTLVSPDAADIPLEGHSEHGRAISPAGMESLAAFRSQPAAAAAAPMSQPAAGKGDKAQRAQLKAELQRQQAQQQRQEQQQQKAAARQEDQLQKQDLQAQLKQEKLDHKEQVKQQQAQLKQQQVQLKQQQKFSSTFTWKKPKPSNELMTLLMNSIAQAIITKQSDKRARQVMLIGGEIPSSIVPDVLKSLIKLKIHRQAVETPEGVRLIVSRAPLDPETIATFGVPVSMVELQSGGEAGTSSSSMTAQDYEAFFQQASILSTSEAALASNAQRLALASEASSFAPEARGQGGGARNMNYGMDSHTYAPASAQRELRITKHCPALYLHLYELSMQRTLVASLDPLPDYRPEFDPMLRRSTPFSMSRAALEVVGHTLGPVPQLFQGGSRRSNYDQQQQQQQLDENGGYLPAEEQWYGSMPNVPSFADQSGGFQQGGQNGGFQQGNQNGGFQQGGQNGGFQQDRNGAAFPQEQFAGGLGGFQDQFAEERGSKTAGSRTVAQQQQQGDRFWNAYRGGEIRGDGGGSSHWDQQQRQQVNRGQQRGEGYSAVLVDDWGDEMEEEDQAAREKAAWEADALARKVAREEIFMARLDGQLQQEQRAQHATPKGMDLLGKRALLPAYVRRADVLAAVQRNQVLLISGETGCGKSTQVPQFVLETEIAAGRGGHANIVCTQPRRISAISLAKRVADERGERAGDVVGFRVRGDSAVSSRTRLTFCTTGVLLRRLLSEPDLAGVTHIVVDEIHERKMNEDFLLIILRDLLPRRPDLKLILMSATLNADQFSTYFEGCGLMHIPGRTFPVEEFFMEDVLEMTGHFIMNERDRSSAEKGSSGNLQAMQVQGSLRAKAQMELAAAAREHSQYDWHCGYSYNPVDYQHYGPRTKASLANWMEYKEDKIHLDLVAATVQHIASNQGPGAILVFLTGLDEITKLYAALTGRGVMLAPGSQPLLVLPLHSSLPTEQQQMIFELPPPGMRKVVLATNIAETSITISDVVYVVDAGKAKEKSYDIVNKLATLLPAWITLASAKQRMGRAGRVQPGKCYHLFPRLMAKHHFAEHEIPELLRTPLTELALQIKYLGLGDVAGFLSRAISPPSPLP